MRTKKNGNLSLLSFLDLDIKTENGIFSILMSRAKNVAYIPLCSSFIFHSPEYMHLKDFENS